MSTEKTDSPTPTQPGDAPADRLHYIPPGHKLVSIGAPFNAQAIVPDNTLVTIRVKFHKDASGGALKNYILGFFKRGPNLS